MSKWSKEVKTVAKPCQPEVGHKSLVYDLTTICILVISIPLDCQGLFPVLNKKNKNKNNKNTVTL